MQINHALAYVADLAPTADELAFRQTLRRLMDVALWELLCDLRPESWPTLQQVRHLSGGRFLLRLNGTWDGSIASPKREEGAPVVADVQVSGKDQLDEIGPFATSGSYQFYCPLHVGMQLTAIVQSGTREK
jgi:hypothetical protein